MKHADETLQAAIDAACNETFQYQETLTGSDIIIDPSIKPHWANESQARLALAKAFLAKLPEPEPILADDGRSLGQVAYEAPTKFRARLPWEESSNEARNEYQTIAQAVAKVVLAQAIRRMEAVPVDELRKVGANDPGGIGGPERKAVAIRARLIAAARGEAEQQAEKAKPAPSTFEAHGKVWTRHTPGDPMPCKPEALVQVILERELDGRDKWGEETNPARKYCWGSENECCPIVGWRYADEPDSTDWKAKYAQAEAALAESEKQFQAKVAELLETLDRAEKAEAELAAIKSSSIGILRPLSEAGPVPDGCVRVTGDYDPKYEGGTWAIGVIGCSYDTHFADIRLPSTETPANEAADPYARLKAYAKAGARIRCMDEFGGSGWEANGDWGWYLLPENYEVHPDDLYMVPEYAPANEQPKQQVPLGPEDVMPGSVFRAPHWSDDTPSYLTIEAVAECDLSMSHGATCSYDMLKDQGYKINRSIPLTGKWDANAWEPCHKLI